MEESSEESITYTFQAPVSNLYPLKMGRQILQCVFAPWRNTKIVKRPRKPVEMAPVTYPQNKMILHIALGCQNSAMPTSLVMVTGWVVADCKTVSGRLLYLIVNWNSLRTGQTTQEAKCGPLPFHSIFAGVIFIKIENPFLP